MANYNRMVELSLFATPIGECGIAWRGDIVVATHLPERTASATAARLATHTDGVEGTPPAAIQDVISSITSLLEGQQTDLADVECDFSALDQFARCTQPFGHFDQSQRVR